MTDPEDLAVLERHITCYPHDQRDPIRRDVVRSLVADARALAAAEARADKAEADAKSSLDLMVNALRERDTLGAAVHEWSERAENAEAELAELKGRVESVRTAITYRMEEIDSGDVTDEDEAESIIVGLQIAIAILDGTDKGDHDAN